MEYGDTSRRETVSENVEFLNSPTTSVTWSTKHFSEPLLPKFNPQSSYDDEDVPLNIQKAAALVSEALRGRWMPLEVVQHINFQQSKRAFILYHEIAPLRAISYIILLLLPFFQEPLWHKRKLPADMIKKFPLSGFGYIPDPIYVLIEVLCFLPLLWSVVLQRKFQGPESFGFGHKVFLYKVLVLAGMVIGILQSAGRLVSISIIDSFRISTFVHLLVPLIFNRTLRLSFFITAQTVPDFLDITILLIFFLLLSSWCATSLFKQHVEFKNYSTALLNLFILLTTSNSPDVWAPTYTENHFTFIFFFLFIGIGLFFLMNLLFSIIYSNYKIQITKEVERDKLARQETLQQAFKFLDVNRRSWIDAKTTTKLFLAVFQYRKVPNDRAKRTRLFLALDRQGNFRICAVEFEKVIKVISNHLMKEEKETSTSDADSLSWGCLMTEQSYFKVIGSLIYRLLKWTFIFSSVAFTVADLYMRDHQYSPSTLIIVSEYFIAWVFVADDVFKLLAMGGFRFWSVSLNRWNAYISLLTVVVTPVSLIIFRLSIKWIFMILLGRAMLGMIKLRLFVRWLVIATTLKRLIPATLPVFTLQYCICSLFSLVGIEIFGGLIYYESPSLEGTAYANLNFWDLNYNDFASAMVANFSLCIVNNWFILMDAFVAASDTQWARAYFILFWAIVVAFILNAVIAFFVEAFTRHMEKTTVSTKKKLRNQAGNRTFSESKSLSMKKTFSCYDLYAEFAEKDSTV